MPIVLRCDSAAIKATRLKLESSLYVPGARVGAGVLSCVKVVEPLLYGSTSVMFCSST